MLSVERDYDDQLLRVLHNPIMFVAIVTCVAWYVLFLSMCGSFVLQGHSLVVCTEWWG